MEKDREILIKTQLELNAKLREVEVTRIELLNDREVFKNEQKLMTENMEKDREVFKNEQKLATENMEKDRETLIKTQSELNAKLRDVEIARAEIARICNLYVSENKSQNT